MRGELADAVEAVRLEALAERLSHAPDQAHGPLGEEGARLGPPDHGEAARLVEIGGDLGEELVVGEPDRDGDAEGLRDAALEARERAGGTAMVEPGGAGEIEEGLIDRERLDEGRGLEHEPAHFPADGLVLAHVGPDDGRLRAKLERLEHRHGRAHAIDARDIAGGRDHAALPAADDDRLVAQLRVVALLHAGIEGIAVDVRDREQIELGVGEDSGRGAMRTAAQARPRRGRDRPRTVAAEGRHAGVVPGGQSQAAPRAPLASPWSGGTSLVSTRSEKTCLPQCRGTCS